MKKSVFGLFENVIGRKGAEHLLFAVAYLLFAAASYLLQIRLFHAVEVAVDQADTGRHQFAFSAFIFRAFPVLFFSGSRRKYDLIALRRFFPLDTLFLFRLGFFLTGILSCRKSVFAESPAPGARPRIDAAAAAQLSFRLGFKCC